MAEIVDVKKEEPKEPQPLSLVITMYPNGQVQVQFPLLQDKIFTYGFLKIGEKALDKHYESSEPKIEKPQGKILDFVRKLH